MNDDERAEINICHAYLNALHAGLQGKYAMLNMLAQLLGGKSFNEEKARTAQTLEKVLTWCEHMWDHQPLQFLSGPEQLGEDVIEVIDLFEILKSEIKERAETVKTILSKEDLSAYPEEICMLSALYGYQTYARDHYIKGLVTYGDIFGPEVVADRWRQQLLSCQDGIRQAHYFLDLLKKDNLVDESFVYSLRDEALLLPAIFRCQVHDMNQINGMLRGEFTFPLAEFTPDEAEAWEEFGFSAKPAGYWRAYEVPPYEVYTWLDCGFADPGVAGSWRYRGFSAREAMDWASAGFSSKEAQFYASSGCDTPEMAERAQELVH